MQSIVFIKKVLFLFIITSNCFSEIDVIPICSIPQGIHGIAVSNSGDIYFSDSFGNVNYIRKIYKIIEPYTNGFEEIPIVGQLPAGLLWDDNNLYVADTQNNNVRKFNSNYELLNTWTVPGPWLIKKSNNNMIFVTSYNNQLFQLYETGAVEIIISDLAYPFGLEILDDNSIWISEQGGIDIPGAIRKWSFEGQYLDEILYNWDNPEGLQLDVFGNLWIADTGAGKIFRYTNDGSLDAVVDNLNFPIIITNFVDNDLIFNTSGDQPYFFKISIADPCDSYNQIFGDLNQDGNTDIFDLITLVDNVLINITPSYNNLCLMDLNTDSNINISDIVILAGFIFENE